MKIVRNIAIAVLVFLSVSVLAYVGYLFCKLISAVISGAAQLAPEIYVPLSVTLFTAAIGLAATLISQSRIRKREIDAAFRDRKTEVYLGLLKLIEELMVSAKPELGGKKLDEKEMTLLLISLRTKAVLWGSGGVLKALNRLLKIRQGDVLGTMSAVESVQREIRKDLGLSNLGLEPDFFTKLILSDPDELEKLRNSRP